MSFLPENLLLFCRVYSHHDPLDHVQGKPTDYRDGKNFEDECPRYVRRVKVLSEKRDAQYVNDECEHRGDYHLPVWLVDLVCE